MKVTITRNIGEVIEELEIEDINSESSVAMVSLIIEKFNRDSE